MAGPEFKPKEFEAKKSEANSQAVELALPKASQIVPLKLPPQAAEGAHRSMLEAAKNKDQTGFNKIYDASASAKAPPKETAYTMTRSIFLEENSNVLADGTGTAIKRHDDAARDIYLSLGKDNAKEQAENDRRKPVSAYEGAFLTNVGQRLDNDTQRQDMLRAAQQMGYSNEAIRSSGTELNVSPGFLDSLVGPSHALAAEMTFETGQRNSRREMERKLQEADELSEKLIKDWKDGKKVDPSLLAEAQAIEKAKKDLDAGTLPVDQTFLRTFTDQANIEREAMLSAVPVLITSGARSPSTHVPMEEYANLRAYRKALMQPRNA